VGWFMIKEMYVRRFCSFASSLWFAFNLYLKSCFSSPFFVGVWMVAGKMSLKSFIFMKELNGQKELYP